MEPFKIIWSDKAIDSLKKVYEFHEDKSISYARKISKNLIESPKSIHFPHQYQTDPINPKFRRIIVDDYKILYHFKYNTIFIYNIICSKQNPKT